MGQRVQPDAVQRVAGFIYKESRQWGLAVISLQNPA